MWLVKGGTMCWVKVLVKGDSSCRVKYSTILTLI